MQLSRDREQGQLRPDVDLGLWKLSGPSRCHIVPTRARLTPSPCKVETKSIGISLGSEPQVLSL